MCDKDVETESASWGNEGLSGEISLTDEGLVLTWLLLSSCVFAVSKVPYQSRESLISLTVHIALSAYRRNGET